MTEAARPPMDSTSELKQRLIDRLGSYAGIDAVAGYEQAMVERLERDLAPLVDEVFIDPFGNIAATRHGPAGGPSLMIGAHSDEIGGVVKAIEANGLISFLFSSGMPSGQPPWPRSCQACQARKATLDGASPWRARWCRKKSCSS